MERLNPLQSLTFFENNIPDFLGQNQKEVRTILGKLKAVLQNDTTELFHSNLLRRGKDLFKFLISNGIQYLSEEVELPSDRSVRNVIEYVDRFTAPQLLNSCLKSWIELHYMV